MQLKRKLKHAPDLGIDTRRSDFDAWQAYRLAVMEHMNHAKTRPFGTYRFPRKSIVFYNDQTGVAAVFDAQHRFVTAFIPRDRETSLQRTHYLKSGFLS